MFARRFAMVYAFEPCVESFQTITGPWNLIAFPYAISDHDGTVTLDENEGSIGTGQLVTGSLLNWGETVGRREVPCYTLDTFCLEHDVWPDMVKVDVEGHEVQVLDGAKNLIRKGRVRWFIEVHSAAFLPRLRARLSDYTITIYPHTSYAADDPARSEHFYMEAQHGNSG